jgi:enolase
MYAVAKCYCVNNVFDGFKQSFYPYDEDIDITRNTKLLISVFNGGKAANSVVKFTKFYLIVDAAAQGGATEEAKVDPIRILGFYQKFLVGLKKGIHATKAGEAGFKLGVDGVYFNANANIAESFKMIEEAIVLSGANDDGRKLFQIGVNADADSGYNKDAKDPGKYEQEGQKIQFGVEAMIEYYTKMLQEHPLLSYMEDAFAQFDFAGHKELKEKLQNEFPHVNMGLRQVFRTGGFARLK